MTYREKGHAIIVGGGMSGLFAARILSQHFTRVTLVERDRLPTGSEHRSGVPQSHHVQALLLRGLVELERMFPGIEQDLTREGAARVDLGNEVAHCTEWGWAQRAPGIGIAPLALSRLLIENVVRERVRREVKNLTLRDETRVADLLIDQRDGRVCISGIRLDDGEQLTADLVVDAGGRNSKGLSWLQRAGVAAPSEEIVDAHAGYASRFYELAPDNKRWWRGMVIDPKPPAMKRWGLLMPIENGYHVLTLAGVNQDYPPSDEAEFNAYLASLRSPVLGQELSRARPISDIRTHRALSNRARHFDTWQVDVDGFIAIGDSAIAFNAAHGQGVSMAAVSANALGDLLKRSPGLHSYEFTRRFHRTQWKQLNNAWVLATGADLQWPGTVGARPFGYGPKIALAALIARAAHEDAAIKRTLGPVYQLIEEPNALLTRPDFLARVAVALARRGLSQVFPQSAKELATDLEG